MQRAALVAVRRAAQPSTSSSTLLRSTSFSPAALRSPARGARGMATEGLTIKDATKADTGVASIAKEEAASSTRASSSSSGGGSSGGGGGAGSIWQRFTAFMTGVGVASAVLYVRVQADIWESSEAVQASVASTKADIAAVNRELRERIAVLEHEVALMKRDR
jgi:hypothetical protein